MQMYVCACGCDMRELIMTFQGKHLGRQHGVTRHYYFINLSWIDIDMWEYVLVGSCEVHVYMKCVSLNQLY